MDTISLIAAANLTGKTRRTLWRWVAEGKLPRGAGDSQGRSTVSLEHIKQDACVALNDADAAMVMAADRGDANAQNDVGLLLLAAQQGDAKKGEEQESFAALYWFELAAQQNHGDALHWLARCHIDGIGVEKNENLGLMYLAKAAAQGHIISQAQMNDMQSRTHQ